MSLIPHVNFSVNRNFIIVKMLLQCVPFSLRNNKRVVAVTLERTCNYQSKRKHFFKNE